MIQVISAAPAGATTNGWSGWVGLGSVTTTGVSAVAQGGQVDLFFEGADGKLWEQWESAGSGQWLGPVRVRPDGALAGTPLALSPSPGVVDVFVRGTDSRIWETIYSNGFWSPWLPIGASFNQTPYGPGGVAQGNQVDLFVTGIDGRLYEDFQDLSTGLWSGFFLVTDQGTLAGAPTAVSPSTGYVQVFGPGTDWPHHIYGITYRGGWSPWALIGNSTNITYDDVGATVTIRGGLVEVFVTGTDGHLYGNTEIGTSWTGFGLVNGQGTLSSGPAAVAAPDGLVAVFGAGTDSPSHIYEISDTGTGVYGSGVTVQSVINNGWAGIGSVSGFCYAPTTAYACPTGSDVTIEKSLIQAGDGIFWLSFWTIGAPYNPSGSADFSPSGWHTDGYTAGKNAATELVHLNGPYLPDFVILDPEGFGGQYPGYKDPNTGSVTPCSGASYSACWGSWITGWAEGLKSVSSAMRPAFYASQSPIKDNNLLSLGIPAFPAVSPIIFNSGQGNTPFVTGSTVTGYIAYYAQCPADPYALQVTNWGAKYNTVQFQDSNVDCQA